ncbi:hypothetical protein SDC9_75325 [bioreactor metagenome]|uniref:Fluoroquinolones export permease protein n=1 Tax=bioreactor metagenome TaxID=1076179 RepID=A0A644YJP4_9ZZZZ
MRFLSLLKNELRFAAKYGILPLYILLSAFYVVLLSAIPEGARQTTGAILIFTDPAAMGLFFMGAVMLLAQSQRVNHALSVSPVTVSEYILSKVLPMLITGTAAGAAIGVAAGADLAGVLWAVMLSSFLFSLAAILVAVKTDSLNSFMLGVVPFELFLSIPALLYLFGVIKSDLWVIHPGVSAIIPLMGKRRLWLYCAISLGLWNMAAFFTCSKAVSRSMRQLGGGRL